MKVVKKNMFFIILFIVLFLCGCSNAKWYDSSVPLSTEENKMNQERLNYLKSIFPIDTDITYRGRRQSTKNCVCKSSYFNSCLKEKCDIVKDKYVWVYDFKSTKSNFWGAVKYDDKDSTWSERPEFIANFLEKTNNIVDSLTQKNIEYMTVFPSGGEGSIIKGDFVINMNQIDDAKNFLFELDESNYDEKIDICFFENKYYYKYYNNENNNFYNDCYLMGEEVKIIDVNPISENMFQCNSEECKNYNSFIYHLIFKNNQYQLEIRGIN